MLQNICRGIFFRFSNVQVPVVDVEPFLKESGDYIKDCKTVSESLHKYGVLIIKDPRVNQQQNATFLDMMERYFSKRGADLYAGRKVADIYPEYNFQVGATPEFTEKALDHKSVSKNYTKENSVFTPSPPPSDAKWRYFWNVGNPIDAEPNQAPNDFPEFRETMDAWGNHMINGCNTVAEMTAIGLGLERDSFTKLMKDGPHKLAPTGSDLEKYDVGTVFAGFHYDFNFLTIHGKSRYPGLFAWMKNGERFTVKVPEGHLLLQAGKELEYLTGGYINCGYHEVIYTEAVKEGKENTIKQGGIPWRVSSTLFSHIRYGVIMEPLGKFKTPEALAKYPPIDAKQYSLNQLDAINLKHDNL